jgi:hypothetical protein
VLGVLSAFVLSLIPIILESVRIFGKGSPASIASLQSWKMKTVIIALHLLTCLSTITAILHYLNIFLVANLKIDYSLMLILGAALLAVLGAVLYRVIVGYSLQQTQEVQHHAVTLLMQTFGVLAIILAVLGIAPPRWMYTFDERGDTFSLWQHCNNEVKCSSYTDDEFRIIQVLAVVGLGVLVLSVIMSILTSFIGKQSVNVKVMVLSLLRLSVLALYATFFWFITFYFRIVANKDIGYSLTLMIFSAASTGVAAGIVQAVVLGHSMGIVDKF